jgi:hypothetical protein
MLLASVSGATSVVVLWSLWIRREAVTWRCRWETATNLAFGFFILTSLLTRWSIGAWVGDLLYTVTAVDNLQFYLGNLAFLAGLCCLTYSAVTKLTPDPDGRPRHDIQLHWFKTRILAPVIVSDVVTYVLFYLSRASERPCPHFLTAHKVIGPWVSAYWVVYCATVAYVLYEMARAYLDIWRDGPSRRIVQIYLLGAGLLFIAVVCRVLSALPPDYICPVDICFAATSLGVTSLATAAAYSWRCRTRYFTQRPLPVREVERPGAV